MNSYGRWAATVHVGLIGRIGAPVIAPVIWSGP